MSMLQVIVNNQVKTVPALPSSGVLLRYERIVEMAGFNPHKKYTVNYYYKNAVGSLVPNSSIRVPSDANPNFTVTE